MLPPDYQGFLGCAVERMTSEVTHMLVQALLNERVLLDLSPEQLRVEEEEIATKVGFGWNVLTKRLAFYDIPTTLMCRLFVLQLCENPAQAVLWAFTLGKIWEKNGYKPVTLVQLCDSFPDGFPTDAEYRRLWDLQKRENPPRGGMDNWLDYGEVWPRKPEEKSA